MLGAKVWLTAAYSAEPPSLVEMLNGKRSPLSVEKIRKDKPTFLRLFTHLMRCALALALARAGSNIPARIAIIAITTNSSMSVKAPFLYLRKTLFILSFGYFGLRCAHSNQTSERVSTPFL